ncbi:Imm32 family immunity protein [Micromonospora sp. I033]
MWNDAPMNDHRLCRLSTSGGELELAGPPAALRALALLLRKPQERVEAQVSGGVVVQERTEGPLTVSLRGDDTLHLAGGHRYLGIAWDAFDGVAEQAESAEDRGVRRHQHIEYLAPDDEYRSPRSVPLIIVSDWPGMA